MSNTYVKPGGTDDWINDTAGNVVSGDVVVMGANGGAMIGVALVDIAIGEKGSVMTSGVHDLPKADAAVIAHGEPLLWDSSAGEFDDGAAVAAAGDVDGSVRAVESKGATVGGTIRVELGHTGTLS